MKNKRLCYVLSCSCCDATLFLEKPSRERSVAHPGEVPYWQDPDGEDSEDDVEEVNFCPACHIYEDCGHSELLLEDLENSDQKALLTLWRAIGKLLPKETMDKEATKRMKLSGNEKRKIKEKIEEWIEENTLDYFVDTDQMWKDHVMVRCCSPDGLPIVLVNMATGWEPFVFGSEMLSEEEHESLRKHLTREEA